MGFKIQTPDPHETQFKIFVKKRANNYTCPWVRGRVNG